MRKFFTQHPESVGESYVEHMSHALFFSGRLFVASLACLVHALLPFLFVTTGSRAVTELYERMVSKRRRDHRQPEEVGSPLLKLKPSGSAQVPTD